MSSHSSHTTSQFKKCVSCPAVMPGQDNHIACVQCLDLSHFVPVNQRSCRACLSLQKRSYNARLLKKAATKSVGPVPPSIPLKVVAIPAAAGAPPPSQVLGAGGAVGTVGTDAASVDDASEISHVREKFKVTRRRDRPSKGSIKRPTASGKGKFRKPLLKRAGLLSIQASTSVPRAMLSLP